MEQRPARELSVEWSVVPSEMEDRADSSFILKFYLYICITDATKSDDTR